MTPPLTPEQMLLIADEFCVAHRVRVRDFGGLVAAAAVPGAHLSGIPVHGGIGAAGRALEEAVRRLEPLSAHNLLFGEMCREVYQMMHS